MNETVMIKCRKCGAPFQPDMKTSSIWRCPTCQAKNPNLKRHYRSVGDLCILGLILSAIVVAVGFGKTGLSFDICLSGGQTILLLVTIVQIYKSKMPWADRTAKALIWTVFSIALLFNVIVPLVFLGMLNIPATVIYALVFPYLFWLKAQSDKCTMHEGTQAPLQP